MTNNPHLITKPSFLRIGPNYDPSLKPYTLETLANKKNEELGGLIAMDQIQKDIFSRTQIICTTLSIAGSSLLSLCKQPFDTVIIDEAGQTVEPSVLIPLQYKCERLILLGDSKQLQPTVFSRIAGDLGYKISLFERLQLNKYPSTFLNVQYRMSPEISKYISEQFYKGKLVDSPGINRIVDNMTCFGSVKAFHPFRFYSLHGKEEQKSQSYSNLKEARFIEYLLEFWVHSNKSIKRKFCDFKADKIHYENSDLSSLPKHKIGVISPYKSQINLLNRTLSKFVKAGLVEIKTVDGFQGREKGRQNIKKI
jgi:senataxin